MVQHWAKHVWNVKRKENVKSMDVITNIMAIIYARDIINFHTKHVSSVASLRRAKNVARAHKNENVTLTSVMKNIFVTDYARNTIIKRTMQTIKKSF